jgi:hypothetical protein
MPRVAPCRLGLRAAGFLDFGAARLPARSEVDDFFRLVPAEVFLLVLFFKR